MTPERSTTQADKIVVHIDAELQELIPGYLDNRQADIQALREALEQGDYETIRILGHSMKGSGGGYGFDAITEIGSALEQAAKDREPDAIRRWVGELVTYLERVQVVYD
ncbi:MAG: Hpt domain-containing protein [Nitrospinae bacterium]|nr:Hpt domain-containing protein [Nitrospinota bacterium]